MTSTIKKLRDTNGVGILANLIVDGVEYEGLIKPIKKEITG